MIEIKHYPYKQGWLWYKEARDLLLKDFWFWMKLIIGYFLVSYLLNLLQSSLPSPYMYITMLPTQLAYYLFGIGMTKLVIHRRHGNPLSLGVLFDPLKKGTYALRCLNILVLSYLIPIVGVLLIFIVNFTLEVSLSDYTHLFDLIQSQHFSLIPPEMIQILIADVTLLSVLMFLFLAMIAFAPNLIGVYDCSTFEAMKLSFRANFKNIGAFLVTFGILLMAFFSIILTLGLAVFFWIPWFIIMGSLIIDDIFKLKIDGPSGIEPNASPTEPLTP